MATAKNIQRRLAALLKAVLMAAELRGGWILRVHLLVLLVLLVLAIAVRSLCGVLPVDVTDRNFLCNFVSELGLVVSFIYFFKKSHRAGFGLALIAIKQSALFVFFGDATIVRVRQ